MDKKGLVVVVILLFLGMSVVPSTGTVADKKFTMPTNYDGDTLYVGGSGSDNYTRIQDAIDDAGDGDTVFVYDGSSPYYENLIIDKSINLTGEDRNLVIVDGTGKENGTIKITSDNVQITRFTIQNSYESADGAILVYYSDYITIKDNIINENNGNGIFLYHSSYSSITQNIISNNTDSGVDISFFGSNYNTISHNIIVENSWHGIRLWYSDRNIINSNKIMRNNQGIRICNSDNNVIYHNNFINNVQNAYDECNNTWDNSYWSGGNYWSDYNGDDFSHGPCQNKLGRDWRGDTPYNISGGSNQDRYPLILPYESEPPFAIIEHPSDGLITSEHNVTIIGYITDNVGLVKSGTIYGSGWGGITYKSESLPPYELTPQIDFNFNNELDPGWNEIGIHATDPSDNYGEDIVLVYYYPDIVYVDDDYSSSTQGWQQYCFDSIQDGVDAVAESGTVYVYNGTYYETLIIDKSINLVGSGDGEKIIDYNGNESNQRYIVLITADNCTINGFKIINSNDSSNIMGISIESSNNVISTNTILNATKGVYIGRDSGNNNVLGNNISHNQYGINIEYSDGNNISKNNISLNSLYDMYIYSSNNNIVTGNIISDGDYGIRIKGSKNNEIFRNLIINNQRGLNFCCGARNNIMYYNTFKQNSEYNAYDRCNNTWDNGYPSCGNYWDDYIGEDSDGDGVGDTPYNIPGGDNQDRYPLMEPYGMTELAISTGSGLFVSGIIKNIGNKTAFNVQWKITFDGGIILMGRESSGYLARPLLVGEEMIVSSGIVIGFGHIVITVSVWADNAPLVSKSIHGFLFLFFIKIT